MSLDGRLSLPWISTGSLSPDENVFDGLWYHRQFQGYFESHTFTLDILFCWKILFIICFGRHVSSPVRRLVFDKLYLLVFNSLISLDTTEPLNCQALYTFNQVFGNAAIGLASVNLSLRT